jgi:excisionase family DNA binding protein
MPMPHHELTFEQVVSDPKLAFDRDFRVGTAADRGVGERWDHRDHFLEAALERELDSAENTALLSPTVEAWARLLGLEGTALLTTEEAASLLRICERSVRQGIKDGQIPHLRLGRRLFIPAPKLLAMLLEGDPDG